MDLPSTPKRVLIVHKLNLTADDLVRLFLLHSGRRLAEYDDEQKHFVHLDPNEPGDGESATVLVDWDYGSDPLQDLKNLPHEIYRARDFKLIQPETHKQYYDKIRVFTDRYSWGPHKGSASKIYL